MAGGRSVNVQSLEDECKHASDMEQLAANAERASIKYKQVEFMGERLGEEYDGVISGITEWGLYVEINENKCEGLVPIRDLEDDYYEFDEKNYCLMGVASTGYTAWVILSVSRWLVRTWSGNSSISLW